MFNEAEIESDKAIALKRVLNMSKDEIRAAVKHGRECGALTKDAIDPDPYRWRAWQVGMVCALADALG